MFKKFKLRFYIKNCLFWSAKLTKNADLDKYKYSDHDIGLDSRSEFLFTDGNMGKNIIIFWANMSSSVQIDNKGKYILILDEWLTHGLDDTTLNAEVIYPTNFTQTNKRFVLSLQYNRSNSFLFVSVTKTY